MPADGEHDEAHERGQNTRSRVLARHHRLIPQRDHDGCGHRQIGPRGHADNVAGWRLCTGRSRVNLRAKAGDASCAKSRRFAAARAAKRNHRRQTGARGGARRALSMRAVPNARDRSTFQPRQRRTLPVRPLPIAGPATLVFSDGAGPRPLSTTVSTTRVVVCRRCGMEGLWNPCLVGCS